MAMSVPTGDDDEDKVMSEINTTPLVDVMLVLLIIFLITIPVVIQTTPVNLPKEANVPTVTKPENVTIAVTKDGDLTWNAQPVPDYETLFQRFRDEIATKNPQPEVHIRGDADARYEMVGRVIVAAQRASIYKIGYILEPPSGVGTVSR